MSSHVISQPLHTCKRTNTHIHTTSEELIAGYERSSVHAPRDGIQTNIWCCHTTKKMNQHWCWHDSSCYCNLLKTKHVSSPNLHASSMNKKANSKRNPVLFYVLYAFWTYASNPGLSDWYSAEHRNPPFAFFCLPDCENDTSIWQIHRCYFEMAVLDRCVSPNRFTSRTKPKWKGKRCAHTGKSVLSG